MDEQDSGRKGPRCAQCGGPGIYGYRARGARGQVFFCVEHNLIHQQSIDLQLQRLGAAREQVLEDFQAITGVRLYPPRPAPIIGGNVTTNNIRVDGNVGVINTGTIHRLNLAMQKISSQGGHELGGALKALAEAVIKSAELADEQKREAVGLLQHLAEQASLPKEQRNTPATRVVMTNLKDTLALSSGLVTLWARLEPLIRGLLGG